jgi:methionyl-tRNA formyltransferase
MSEELEHLISMGVEMFIVAEYLHILPETGVKYAINIHPSMLPKGRGPTPLPYLLKYPEHSGVSIHKLTNVLDGGDVILQSGVPIQKNESITTVMVKMHIEAVNLIKTFLSDVECHYKNAKPQTDYSYFPRIDIGERILDWKQRTLDINSKLRSFGFFGLILKLNNLFWNAKHIEAVECVHLYEAGEVIYEDEYLLVVSSYDGIVCVHKYSLSLVT